MTTPGTTGPAATTRNVGDLAEVLGNLGVFSTHPEDLIAPCASGFRRVPISQGTDYYVSLQGFAPNQFAYAHTHPDSEEWIKRGEHASATNPAA